MKLAHQPAIQPGVSLELDGKHYELVFTFGAIRSAMNLLHKQGVQTRMLSTFSAGKIDADTLPELFYAALHTYHPEVTWEKVAGMITLRNYQIITAAVAEAYLAALKDPEPDSAEEKPRPQEELKN